MKVVGRLLGYLVIAAAALGVVHAITLHAISRGADPSVTPGEVYVQVGHILSETIMGGGR